MSPHKTASPIVPHFQTPASPAAHTNDSLYSRSQYSESSENTSLSSLDDTITANPKRPLQPGIYVPTVTFFHEPSEDLDVDTIASHAVRLAKAGIAGLVTQGSNGEAVHLTHAERKKVTQITREALDRAGFRHLPIIVGCGAQSVRETVELCQDALAAGGDYALVLPPSYYKATHASQTVIDFFNAVADASPIPIVIYNFPGAVSGLDMDSETISSLAKNPKIVGCKLTCGNTGKLARIASATAASSPLDPNSESGFLCCGGSADFTLQTMIVGGSGVICGVGNVAPKACVQVFDLFKEGQLAKAREAQAIVARGDGAAIKGGIAGTKSALETYYGYGGYPRRPLPRPDRAEEERYREAFRELIEYEKLL